MSVNDVLGFLKGYVVIRGEGCFLERFLNICMRRGIFLRDVKRRDEFSMEASISIKGFKELRPIAKKTKTHVAIKSRHGLPFILHRYRKRRFAVIGVFLFVVIMWYLSSHIMGIDIIGNQRIPSEDIERELKNVGLYRGVLAGKIEPKSVQNKMMTKFDSIAWIGISIKGSRAYVEVKERLDTEKSEDRDIPCNLIAQKDGMIRLLEVKAGQTVVGVNDMVEKGDLLVSGVIDSQKEGIRYAHSFGEVYADTEYEKIRVYPLKYTEKIYTGKEKSRIKVTVFGKEIPLFIKSSPPYEYSDKTEKSTEYSFLGKRLPPIYVNRMHFKEYTPVKKTRTLSQTVKLGEEELCGELKKEISPNAKIKDTTVTYKEVAKDAVEVRVKIYCYEDIAVQSAIDKTENMNYDNTME